MAQIEDSKLHQIKQLYLKEKKSAREIAEKMNVSLDAVYYFLRKYNIPRRTAVEQNQIRFLRKIPSFSVKHKLSKDEEGLKIAGITLYWTEGSQWPGEQIVDFANSNPEMILIFLRFLKEICGINLKKLRIYLYCYSNQKPKQLIKFWSKLIGIPEKQFTKPYIRSDFQPQKMGKMQYGLVHVRYGDKKLLILIKQWIEEFIRKFRIGKIKNKRVDGRVVKCPAL